MARGWHVRADYRGRGGGGGSNVSGYLGAFLQAGEQARQRTQERLDQALALYEQNIALYQPGGEFGKGYEAQIAQAKKTSVSGGLAHLAKTGLYNTTIGAGLGTAFEKTVGADARLKLQDMRIGRLADATAAKAGVLERVNDVGPDPSLFANLAMQAANKQQFLAPAATVSSPHPWERDYMGGSFGLSGGSLGVKTPVASPNGTGAQLRQYYGM